MHSYSAKSPLVPVGRPRFTPKTAPFPSTITTPSNTPITRPTPLITLNGIRIHSAVLPQYTFRTDRHTDRHTQRPTRLPAGDRHAAAGAYIRVACTLLGVHLLLSWRCYSSYCRRCRCCASLLHLMCAFCTWISLQSLFRS